VCICVREVREVRRVNEVNEVNERCGECERRKEKVQESTVKFNARPAQMMKYESPRVWPWQTLTSSPTTAMQVQRLYVFVQVTSWKGGHSWVGFPPLWGVWPVFLCGEEEDTDLGTAGVLLSSFHTTQKLPAPHHVKQTFAKGHRKGSMPQRSFLRYGKVRVFQQLGTFGFLYD
jgi:hypothetical protein